MIMPVFRGAFAQPNAPNGFFVLIREYRDCYERVYGQLRRPKANSNEAF